MMETIIEQLQKVPVCELDGQLRRVRRILPAEFAVAWRISGAAGNLQLTANARVCFYDGDTLTAAELTSARQYAPDSWQVRRQDGRVQTLRLFTSSAATDCRITVTHKGSTRQACRPVHQLTAPAAALPAGTATPAAPAAAPAGADHIASRG